jgi:hypothetical protein
MGGKRTCPASRSLPRVCAGIEARSMRTGILTVMALLFSPEPGSSPANGPASATAYKEAGPIEIVLRGGLAREGPVVTMVIANRSARPVCISAETLRNPRTNYIQLEFRNRGGRPVRPRVVMGVHAYDERIEGIVRLKPGASASARYDMRSRVMPPLESFPDGWSAQAVFIFGYCQPHPRCVPTPLFDCTDNYTEAATSSWQRLDITNRR